MRILLLVATVSAIAWARPETYRETEDFQYARSSSDEGSKSGYYGAQRGNMAGNYEKAHNMDSLAQHQMSGAINQVEGELGDASKTRAGSVYTAANSRGVYGSGHYDLGNLQGRNFGESSSADSSHSSMSSAFNQQALNSDWRSQSQRTGYSGSNQLGQSSLHAAEGASGYGASNYGTSHSTGYHSASGYHSQSGYNSLNNYDQSNLNQHSSTGYGAQADDQARRYTIVTPVRLVGRPGTQIAIPVYGQAYDTHRASLLYDQNLSHSQSLASQSASSAFDQNAINSEAEVLNNNHQHISSVPTVPVTDGKHYSSSYNYRKAWERHSETTDLPVAVAPTVSPLPKHSELYEDAQSASGSAHLQQANSRNSYTGSAYNSANRYNGYTKSGSSQSRHQSDYSSLHSSDADANSNAYTQGTYGTDAGVSRSVESQPKSYQSSYSYHKSWEKQGDPYVIIPPTNGEASQRIVSGVKSHASSQHHGSQSQQHYSQGSAADCDTLCRYRRDARSYSTSDYYQQNQEDLGQKAQTGWEENLDQQTQQHVQSQKLEDLGQKTQESWADLQQQSNSEDLGQQTQQTWGDEHHHQHHQKLEDLGQQPQHSWDNFQQQSQPQKLEDFGQQTQQSWDNFQQESQSQKLEDLGQQAQGKWHELDQDSDHNLEDLGQQTQQLWDKSNIDQQISRHNVEDLGQQTQGQWDKMETNNQQFEQSPESITLGQQTNSKWDNFDSLDQHTNTKDVGYIEQQNKPQQTEDLGQQSQNTWDSENLGQQVQTQWNIMNTVNKTRHTDTVNTEQQTQTQFEQGVVLTPSNDTKNIYNKENSNLDNPDHPAFWGLTDEQRHENNNYSNYNSYSNSQKQSASWQEQTHKNNAQTTNSNPLQSLWDKIDNMEQQSEHVSNENQQQTGYEISQHSYNGQDNFHHYESKWEHEHSSHNQNQNKTQFSGYQSPIAFNNTADKPKDDYLRQDDTAKKPKDDDFLEKPVPAETGRGDIGSEDDLPTDVTISKKESGIHTYTTQIKPEKTSDEIEALSLSRGTAEVTNQSDSLGVLSLSQQKWIENQRKRTYEFNQNHSSGSESIMTTTTTISSSVINGQHNQNFDQLTGQELEDFGQQSQQNLPQFQIVGQQTQSFDQQSTGQDLVDFGQQTQDLSQQHVQQLENFAKQNLDQQQTGQELEDLGQQTQEQNLQQFSQNFEQQNTGPQLEDFGQHSQDLSQQSVHQFETFGKHSQQNTEQQLEDFRQQSQDQNQENLKYENLGQHAQNLEQHEAREFVPISNLQPIQEQKITPVSNTNSQTHPKEDVEILKPLVTTTEKPGFWKSVGNKFVSAKDTVASWFQKS